MVNVGILGTGFISEIMVEVAKSVKTFEILGVLSRDIEKAQDFARKNQVELAYSDYGDLLENERFDTIYVALPNSLHFDYAMRAVSAGKSVIVEKPFVSNLDELDELVQAAKENDVYLFELDRVTDGPGLQIIKRHLGEIAPVRMVTINYSQYSRRYDALLAGEIMNVFSDEFSGGALVDLGVYGIHLVTDLFGAPQKVFYCAEKLPNTIDVSGSLTLQYDGMIANLIQSKNSRSDSKMTFQGEKGTLYAEQTPSRINGVELVIPQEEVISMVPEVDGTVANLREIARIIEEGDRDRYVEKLEHISVVMEVLVSARESAGIVFQADS
jgi:predicted dehydrogenase